MRVRFSLLAAFVFAPVLAHATVPKQFSVQGVLRGDMGKLQSSTVNVTVKLWNDQTATAASSLLATPVTTQAVIANNGLFTIPVTVDNALMSKLAGGSPVWLEVTAGNDTFQRQLVTSQMFALMCGSADMANGLPGVTAANGNVGIGTTSPLYPLQIVGSQGSGPAAGTLLVASAADDTGIHVINTAANGHDYALFSSGGNGVGQGSFSIYDVTRRGVPFSINASGNVGIGTTTPPSRLTIGGASTNSSGLEIKNTDVSLLLYDSYGDGTNAGAIQMMAGGTANTIGTTRWRLALQPAGGNVGIGTTSPSAALDVQGSAPGLKVGASCVAGTCPSDRRLKEDIRYLSDALDIIERLKPAAFRYKGQINKELGYGLIAQDVQAVAPELVRKSEDGFLKVNYSPLEMMLIQSVKELKQRHGEETKRLSGEVDSVMAENKRLAAENAVLIARLQRLENAVDKLASASSKCTTRIASK
jgi:hypothetical protein